jgi:Fur family ferric uptake transcriptional regulator
MMMENEHLRRAGLKVTQPRVMILEMLSAAGQHHFSAEEIYRSLTEAGEDIGLATVYRVLTQFETAGLVKRHHFEGGNSVFELEQGEHHDHLVCVKCGLVQEFIDAEIEKRQLDIATRAGFKMTDHALNIYGLCRACQV